MRWFFFVASTIVFVFALYVIIMELTHKASPGVLTFIGSVMPGAGFSAYFNGLEIFGEGV